MAEISQIVRDNHVVIITHNLTPIFPRQFGLCRKDQLRNASVCSNENNETLVTATLLGKVDNCSSVHRIRMGR